MLIIVLLHLNSYLNYQSNILDYSFQSMLVKRWAFYEFKLNNYV